VEPTSAKEQEWFPKTFSESSEKMKENRKNVKKQRQSQRKF
jgi:hypothetical protein